jgi:integrase
VSGTSITFQPTKTAKSSGRSVETVMTPAIRRVIARAQEIKAGQKIASTFLFPTGSGTAYSKTGLHSMWLRAKKRAKITEPYQFKDLRARGAMDAKRGGADISEIQARIVHTSARTSEIYLKERLPEVSNLQAVLPWSGESKIAES